MKMLFQAKLLIHCPEKLFKKSYLTLVGFLILRLNQYTGVNMDGGEASLESVNILICYEEMPTLNFVLEKWL